MRIFVDTVDRIQPAVDELHAQGGGEVLVAPGSYYLTHGIKLRSNVAVRGFGRQLTWFYPADPVTFDEPFFSVRDGDHPKTVNLSLSDFSIDGQFTPDRQAYPEKICRDFKALEKLGARHWRMGVYLTDEFAGTPFENVQIRNIDVFRCANGMHILSSTNVLIENATFSGNGCVIQHHHNLYFRRCNGVRLKNVELSDSPHGVGMNLGNGCSDFLMEESCIHGNGYRGVRFDGLENLSTDIRIRNCLISGNCKAYPGEPALRLHTIKGFEVEGNVFLDNNTDTDIEARLVRIGRIAGNTFLNRDESCLKIAKERRVEVEGNTFGDPSLPAAG